LNVQKSFRVADGKLLEAPDGACPVTAFLNPTEAEKRYCIDVLKIDEHTLASALDPDELSRLEFEPEHVAVIYSRPRNYSDKDQYFFKGGSVGAFLYKDRLVVVVAEDVPLFDNVQVSRVQTNAGILLKMILGAISHFRGHLKAISMIADELQGEINTAMENRQLLHLFTLEKSLVYYLNFIHSNGLLLEKIKHNAARIGFTPTELEILDDVIIENSQCYKQAEISSNIIASLMDARASIVGNNLNALMRNLMVITIAIMTPTLVVSMFSMNVTLPIRHHDAAFWYIIAAAMLSAAGVWLFCREKR
jgi:magnesium transporter